MSAQPLRFWCIIDGGSVAFEIAAPLDANINHVKKLVFEEIKHSTPSNVGAIDLSVWKVRYPAAWCGHHG